MSLLYKPDWEETKIRYKAWWAHEATDRCAMAVFAPKDGAEPASEPAKPSDPLERWTDLDLISRLNDFRLSRTFFGGEAFPAWHLGYPGHTALPVWLGCPITLDLETGWWDPVLLEEDIKLDKIRLNRSKWWDFTIKMLNRSVKETRGKAIPSIGAFGACGDTLAALRGSDRLLFDVADRPEQVIEAEKICYEAFCEVYSEFYSIVHEASEGSTCWFELWAPGKFYAIQNDFAYMIGPEMYQRIFLPQVEKYTQFLDYSVYHVDGVGNFAHVPALCELPRLQAIQILPGAGKPSPLHYMDVLKQVQKAGKNLHLTIDADEVETALNNLSARGLFLSVSCGSEEQAVRLINTAEKLSRDR